MLNYFPKIRLYTCKQLISVLFLSLFTMTLSFSGFTSAEEINTTDELITQNTSLSSQAALKFKHLLSADGLSQNNVFSIAQDHEGFIWIATEDGLNRYDGKNFVYNIDLTSAKYLSSPYFQIYSGDVLIINPNTTRIKNAGIIGNSGTLLSLLSFVLSSIIIISN